MELDNVERGFLDEIRRVQAMHRVRKWSDGIPVKYVCVPDYGNVHCVCHFTPFGFECATCGCKQLIHEGTCDECGAALTVVPDWHAYRAQLIDRERSIEHQWREYGRYKSGP